MANQGVGQAGLSSALRLFHLGLSSADSHQTIKDMSEHIYKKIELVGSSPQGFDGAVKNALERASKTIRNMRWFEVTETRGHIEDGKINHWQVTLKVGFTLDE
jgi:flavin-binding protein dodecin